MTDDLDAVLWLLEPETIRAGQYMELQALTKRSAAVNDNLCTALAKRQDEADGRIARRRRALDAYQQSGGHSPEFLAAMSGTTLDFVPPEADRAAIRQLRVAIRVWTGRDSILQAVGTRLDLEARAAAKNAALGTRFRVKAMVRKGEFDAASALRETVADIYPLVEFDEDVAVARKVLDELRRAHEASRILEEAQLEQGRLVAIERGKVRTIVSQLTSRAIDPKRPSKPLLGEDDYRLCMLWAGIRYASSDDSACDYLEARAGRHEAARLMSARQAELVAGEYYRALGYEVDDISITQIDDENDGSWKDYDLLVDGRSVDVKNARAFGEHYVEHCVPRFKKDRNSRDDVIILGVLSENCTVDQIATGSGTCVVLGEVNVSAIRRIHCWMNERFGELIKDSRAYPDYSAQRLVVGRAAGATGGDS